MLYLNAFKVKAKATHISELVNGAGMTHSSWQGISDLARDFFSDLLTTENSDRANSFDEIFSYVGNICFDFLCAVL